MRSLEEKLHVLLWKRKPACWRFPFKRDALISLLKQIYDAGAELLFC